ncbi:MAG: ATP-binding protein [Phycisphaerae bacterium]|nr:ATP-binding protein [Phycisphaerae bacterium]
MSTPAHVRIELQSNPLYLCGVRDMVSSVARRLGLGEPAAAQIALALDEALCNVIRHGYDRRKDQPIVVELTPIGPAERAEGLRVVIEDRGRQVEPEAIKGRDLADIRPGGLGVHIIREVMDSVVYERLPEVGMRLTMEKRAGIGDRGLGPGGDRGGCGGRGAASPGSAA